MNLQMQRIQAACLELKLPVMATEWSAIADRCASQDASMAEFFEQLLQLELNARMLRTRETLLKLAGLLLSSTSMIMTSDLQPVHRANSYKN